MIHSLLNKEGVILDIKSRLESKEYNFLREEERLKNRMILLTTGGSFAYGTNINIRYEKRRLICLY